MLGISIRRALIGLAVTLSAGNAPAQAPAEVQALVDELKSISEPLQQYPVLDAACQSKDKKVSDYACQRFAALLNEFGDYANAVKVYPFPVAQAMEKIELPTAEAGWKAQPAAAAIAQLAQGERIVMINEAHHVAQTRALTLELLPRLRKLGFTHFAVEALNADDSGIAKRGYSTVRSGYYVREPIMAELIRRAIALGYHLVPYENRVANADPTVRESEQARQLFERSFAKYPQARMLVHAGYAHVHESTGFLFNVQPLAMQLRGLTGIDPLTVDQTVFRPDAGSRAHYGYRKLLELTDGKSPSVLLNLAGTPWSSSPMHFDVSVILPDHPVVQGRPGWMAGLAGRVSVAIPLELCGEPRPCLVQARRVGEAEDAIPADQTLVRTRDRDRALYLAPGRYALSARDAQGARDHTLEIEVKAKP